MSAYEHFRAENSAGRYAANRLAKPVDHINQTLANRTILGELDEKYSNSQSIVAAQNIFAMKGLYLPPLAQKMASIGAQLGLSALEVTPDMGPLEQWDDSVAGNLRKLVQLRDAELHESLQHAIQLTKPYSVLDDALENHLLIFELDLHRRPTPMAYKGMALVMFAGYHHLSAELESSITRRAAELADNKTIDDI